MPTELIHRFVLHGREFLVLHKASACYLRADGRMWADLGAGLEPDEAIELAHIQAELRVMQEREQESALVHRLWEQPLAPEVAALAGDYVCHTLEVPHPQAAVAACGVTVAVDAVYAPFNHNAYICTTQGWRWVNTFESTSDAWAALPQWVQAHPWEGASPCTDHVHRHPNHTKPMPSFGSRLSTEVLVALGLIVLVGLSFALHWAINRWPVLLVVLCAVVFVGVGMGLWWQRREAKPSPPQLDPHAADNRPRQHHDKR